MRSFGGSGEPSPPLPPVARRRMGLNENPYAPTAVVIDAVVRACLDGNRYPTMGNDDLTTVLAGRHRVPPETIVTGPGLVGVCRALVHLMAGPGDEVVLPWPSFDDYLLDTLLATAVPVRSPLAEHRIDLDDMVRRIGPRTRLIFISNPHNPTGTVLGRQELTEFLDRVPPRVLVVLDEAFHDFVRDPDAADGMPMVAARTNLCVLRTFSKAYGLAGFRAAYAVAHPPVAAALRRVLPAFGLSRIAEAAAVASLHDQSEIDRRVRLLVSERDKLGARLRAAGWPAIPSQANFVWLATGESTTAVAARLAAAGIAVRAFPGAGLRITATTEPDRRHLLAVLESR